MITVVTNLHDEQTAIERSRIATKVLHSLRLRAGQIGDKDAFGRHEPSRLPVEITTVD